MTLKKTQITMLLVLAVSLMLIACNNEDTANLKDIQEARDLSRCVDLCGDGECNQQNCSGLTCPCPESPLTCAQDCAQSPSEHLFNRSVRTCSTNADCVPLPTFCNPKYCINEKYLNDDRQPQNCPDKIDLFEKETSACVCEDNLCILQTKYEIIEGK